jgi:hypothetical protein
MIIHSDEFEDVPTRASGTMRIHLFRPATEGRFPALLFYSEIYQVTGPIRMRDEGPRYDPALSTRCLSAALGLFDRTIRDTLSS